jgi:hypothetical protein
MTESFSSGASRLGNEQVRAEQHPRTAICVSGTGTRERGGRDYYGRAARG